MNVLIINYGTSNIKSVFNSLKKIKKIKIYINDFNFKKMDKIILPGQGHIEKCMKFINSIPEFIHKIQEKYVLGICIGYHLFFNKSEESQKVNCLKYINNNIKKISKNCCKNNVPFIGWNNIQIIKNHQIFSNISTNFKQYFMHSYSSIDLNEYSYSITKYNNVIYNSIIIKKKKILFQFHPEKSGNVGLKLLKNFIEL